MSDIRTAIDQARKKISSHQGRRSLNEQNTKGALIEPMLRALGWDIEDPDEVTREYKGKRRDKPVDYALRVMRSPRLFVEAKALGSNLEDRKWAGQVMGYASVAGVKWAVLTDGNEYRIYNTHAPVDVEHKLFRTVSVGSDSPDVIAETLALLSREQLEENRIEALWSIHFVDQQVRSGIETLFADDPDEGLVRLLRKHTSGISAKEVRASLGRVRIDLDFPIIEPEIERPTRKKRDGDSKRVRAKRQTSSPANELQDLISSGALRPPIELEKTYLGKPLRARIETDGTVTVNGKSYDSLSTAGGAAQQAVRGGDKAPATNGWTFWSYRRGDGQMETLAELRDRVRSSKS